MKIQIQGIESYKILKEENDPEVGIKTNSKKNSPLWPIAIIVVASIALFCTTAILYTYYWNPALLNDKVDLLLNQDLNDDNNRPIIGVLTQEYYINHTYKEHPQYSYIPASYVKLIEGSGGRVVPIFILQNESYYEEMFSKINGMLLPGGEIKLNNSGYSTAGQIMLKLAREAYDKNGDYFPVLGECQGLQFLPYEILKKDVIDDCHAWNVTANLEFTKNAASSRLYGSAPKDIMTLLTIKNVTANFHHRCISEKNIIDNHLDKFYNVLSWTKDPVTQIPFVSSMEAKKYPFYGLQFHPEKNLYEWNAEVATQHTRNAIKVGQYFGNFFINEARKSNHKFGSKSEEDKHLIYNFKPTFTGLQQTSLATFEAFEQRFFIPIIYENSA